MIQYLLVFLGAAIPGIEIILAIPLGIVTGLSPIWVIILGFLANLLTVLVVIVGYQKVKDWMDKRKQGEEKEESKRTARGKKIWDKYGMPGVALLGPIFIGAHIAAFLGLFLGAKKSNVTLWMTISLALWSLVFGIATAAGFDFFVNKS